MAEGSFQVIFGGEIIENANLEMVKRNVGKVFKLPAERIDALFCGRRLVLKKDVDQDTAEKYRQAMLRAGAVCEVHLTGETATEPAPAEASPPVKPVTAEAENDANDDQMSLADAGATMGKAVEVHDANIDISTINMSAAGATIGERVEVPDANIDISAIDMSAVGSTIGENIVVPDANIDTGDIAMDEVGVTMAEHVEVDAFEVDISDLDMAEAGSTLVKPKQVAPADIDISELSLNSERATF